MKNISIHNALGKKMMRVHKRDVSFCVSAGKFVPLQANLRKKIVEGIRRV